MVKFTKMGAAVIKYNTGHAPTQMEQQLGRMSWPVIPNTVLRSSDTLYTYEAVVLHDDDGDWRVGVKWCPISHTDIDQTESAPTKSEWCWVTTTRDYLHLGVALQRINSDWTALWVS